MAYGSEEPEPSWVMLRICLIYPKQTQGTHSECERHSVPRNTTNTMELAWLNFAPLIFQLKKGGPLIKPQFNLRDNVNIISL